MTVSDFKAKFRELAGDENISLCLKAGDESYRFDANVRRTVYGDVVVDLVCKDLEEDLRSVVGHEEEIERLQDEAEKVKLEHKDSDRMLAAALIVLLEAGVTKQDLELAARHADPVRALQRLRG